MKLTKKILKEMVLEAVNTYSPVSLSSPRIPTAGTMSRYKPDATGKYKQEDPDVVEGIAESFANFLPNVTNFSDRIVTINKLSDAISANDLQALQKIFGITGQSMADERRTILNTCLALDYINSVVKEYEMGAGAYIYESLIALMTGGSVIGGEGLAADVRGSNNNLYSAKFYRLGQAGSQALEGFPIGQKITYLIGQKSSKRQPVFSSKPSKMTSKKYAKKKRGKPAEEFHRTTDPYEITDISFFIADVVLDKPGAKMLDPNAEEVIYRQPRTSRDNIFSNWNAISIADRKILIQNEMNNNIGQIDSALLAKFKFGYDLKYQPNLEAIENLIDQISDISKDRIKQAMTTSAYAPVLLVNGKNIKGKITNIPEGKGGYGIKPSFKDNGTSIEITWRIEFSKIVSSRAAFFKNRTATLSLVSGSNVPFKQMLEDTLNEPDSLKLKLDECFKHLKEYFANIYDSEAKIRKYIATGVHTDGHQAQTSTVAAATNVKDLLKLI